MCYVHNAMDRTANQFSGHSPTNLLSSTLNNSEHSPVTDLKRKKIREAMKITTLIASTLLFASVSCIYGELVLYCISNH